MSDKICIFAGTTEGRTLAGLLKETAEVTVCVATGYGQILLDGIHGITIHTGRMTAEEMISFFKEHQFDRVVDATHPYALAVTENIAAAAAHAGIPCMRILREQDVHIPGAVYVSSVLEAGQYLAEHSGTALITTGAKELESYAGLDMSRVWVRVLPVASSLEACGNAGIPSAHIIAAQGPFTEEVNCAHLKMIGAQYLVTKASGKAGGFEEKINAAAKCNVVPVIVGQPPQITGLTLDQAVSALGVQYRLPGRKIFLIGIGPGSTDMLTAEARNAIEQCDAVIGAAPVVEALGIRKPCFAEYVPEKVRDVLVSHPAVRKAAVVFRGDIGFFSGAARICKAFEDEDIICIPGVSSLAAFSARLGKNWDDTVWISLHGRRGNYVHAVARNTKVFLLTGTGNTPSAVFKKLRDYGFGTLSAAVGERLTYPDERITRGSIASLAEQEFDSLSVILVENPDAGGSIRFGIDDREFIRGDVPMTKAEVRAVSVSKLELKPDSIVWDIGAGTGSVSVECALAAYNGQVFAVEREPEAVSLIKKNKLKFKTDNITVVSGSAPDVLKKLPAPTHVFIGGTGGNLYQILDVLMHTNPEARIVMNTVTLDSQTEVYTCASQYDFTDFEAISVNISRSKKAGAYTLMAAQNPVTLFIMQKRGING